MRATWSYISSKKRLRLRGSLAVAQNEQLRLQPTCEEIQAVILSAWGINTPSTNSPSYNLNANFSVPSLLICVAAILILYISKLPASLSLRGLGRFVISSKSAAPFCHTQLLICSARKRGSDKAERFTWISSS